MASQNTKAREQAISPITPADRSLARYAVQPQNTIAKCNLCTVLPFDILFLIFDEYVLYETPEHPVETLLLVCKSWSRAALQHAGLWSTFNINYNQFVYWTSCVPRRLGRCPAGTPLDITIQNSDRRPYTGEKDMIEAQEQRWTDIMSTLNGPNGELTQHWRSLTIEGEVSYSPGKSVCDQLLYPTPNLVKLELAFLTSIPSVLVHAPSLKFLTFFRVGKLSLPDLSHALEFTIGTTYAALAERALAKAKQLIDLYIVETSSDEYGISTEHLNLKSLHLCGNLRPNGLAEFSAPALDTIFLKFRVGSEFSSVTSCEGIDLKKIKVVSLEPMGKQGRPNKEYCDALSKFLSITSNLIISELQTGFIAQFVLATLTRENDFLYRDRDVILRIEGCDIALPRDEERSDMSYTLNNALNEQHRDLMRGDSYHRISFYLPKDWKYKLHAPYIDGTVLSPR